MLSPFFLLTIGAIIVLGLMNHPETMAASSFERFDAFTHGLLSGYHTMDLLGSFFFCAVVIGTLRNISKVGDEIDTKMMIKNTLIAASIGAGLLAFVYVGMSLVASYHSSALVGVRSDMLLGSVALQVLGPYAGIVTCLAVVMACLTTAIALASVFSEFLQKDVMKEKISYKASLLFTVVVTLFFSTLEFSGIFKILAPIVSMIYPALLILSLVNIAYKLWGFDQIKFPVASAFGVSLLMSV